MIKAQQDLGSTQDHPAKIRQHPSLVFSRATELHVDCYQRIEGQTVATAWVRISASYDVTLHDQKLRPEQR